MTPEFHRERYLSIAKKTIATLNNVMNNISAEDAHAWRDGGKGWTLTEVLCHLRDYDVIFLNRAKSMLDGSKPSFVYYNHEQMVIDNHYNEQNISDVLAALNTSRAEMITFFDGLTTDQFALEGTHPEYGAWTVMRSLAQVAFHDSNHIEQITRIILEKK